MEGAHVETAHVETAHVETDAFVRPAKPKASGPRHSPERLRNRPVKHKPEDVPIRYSQREIRLRPQEGFVPRRALCASIPLQSCQLL